MQLGWIGRPRAGSTATFTEMITMQFVRVTSTAALFVLFGTVVPAYAQHEQKGEKQARPQEQQHAQQTQQAKPQQQQRAQPTQQAKPQQQHAQQAQQARPQQQQYSQQGQYSQQARQQQQPQRTYQQANTWQQQRGWAQQGSWQPHDNWHQSRARHWESDHRDWGQRGGYGGYYIPQSSFSISFGYQHWFRMGSRPTMYMGYPRFAYGGYSFMLVDPYPEYWGADWYDTDDIYIDYNNGYYLHNRRYPGIGLAITVAM
jgi:hypothetical protein